MTRLGVVRYVNTLPLIRGIEDFIDVSPQLGDPSAVAEALENGRLDVGLVPVATLATHPEWSVVPNLGIASRGAVESVLILSRAELARANRLVIDPASRTSNVLAQIWLEHYLHREIEVVSGPVDLADRLDLGQPTVAIGDAALFWSDPVQARVDLGLIWKDWTGLPFVYAVWAGPGADDPALAEALEACLARNETRIEELARVAEPVDPARRRRVVSYLSHSIRYRLGEAEERGLREYFFRGHEAGCLPAAPSVVCHADLV